MTSQWGSRSTLKAHKNVEAKIQTLQKWKNSKLDDFVSSSWANSTNFLKNGPILASFMFIFVLFTFQFKWQIYNLNNKNWKTWMVSLGLEPGAAWWKAQTNPLSYGGTLLQTFLTTNFLASFRQFLEFAPAQNSPYTGALRLICCLNSANSP